MARPSSVPQGGMRHVVVQAEPPPHRNLDGTYKPDCPSIHSWRLPLLMCFWVSLKCNRFLVYPTRTNSWGTLLFSGTLRVQQGVNLDGSRFRHAHTSTEPYHDHFCICVRACALAILAQSSPVDVNRRLLGFATPASQRVLVMNVVGGDSFLELSGWRSLGRDGVWPTRRNIATRRATPPPEAL